MIYDFETNHKFTALDFFAGSGLVTKGLIPYFKTIWANDICPIKGTVYESNFGEDNLHLCSIQDIQGHSLPDADLSWASFPCQDLSLAGKMHGIKSGSRSALFWEWLRVMEEMPVMRRPAVYCIENVVGFVSADNGKQFKFAYDALRSHGYKVGAIVLNANHFVPQSRARCFMIAVHEDIPVDGLCFGPIPEIHPPSVINASKVIDDPDWIWWTLPPLPKRTVDFIDICEKNAETDPPDKTAKLLSMLSDANKEKVEIALNRNSFVAGTGYKRIRKAPDGVKKQRFEVRFDGLAGCLRTPRGGSSRQIVVIADHGKVSTRLLTIKETARLMGASDTYKLPSSYNAAYMAMGDAVAVPVTNFIARHLLAPLCNRATEYKASFQRQIDDDAVIKKAISYA